MVRQKNLQHLITRQKDKDSAEQHKGELLNRSKSKNEGITKKDKKKHKGIASFSFEPTILEAIRSNANLIDDSEENNRLKPVHITDTYIELAALMAQVVSNPSIGLVLCWPMGIEWVGLAHAVANRVLASESQGERGLRIALYPTVQSNYGRYRHTRVPMQTFLEEARKKANADPDLNVRHLAFMHLNQLENGDDPRRHPSLENAISLFEWDSINMKWSLHGDGYFSDVRIALHHHVGNTKQQKEQISQYATIMADPKQANEAVFRINHKVKPSTAGKLLVNNDLAFDIIIIDARRNLVKNLSSWDSALTQLIENTATHEAAPSLLLLTDNLASYQTLAYKFRTILKLKRKSKKKAPLVKPFFSHHWLRASQTLWSEEENPEYPTTSWPFLNVRITDAQSLFDIGKINTIASSLHRENPKLAHKLRLAAGFLRYVLDMPVGQKTITTWVGQATECYGERQALQFASRYTWQHYKLLLYGELDASGCVPPAVDRAIKVGDLIASRINDSTDIERELINIVSKFSTDSKQVLIMVKSHRLGKLLEDSLKQNIGESITDSTAIHSETLPLDELTKYDALVVAGASMNQIVNLLFINHLPGSITFILDAYTASKVQQEFDTLKGIQAFSAIHSRVESLLSLIEPKIRSFKKVGPGFKLPTNLPTHNHRYANTKHYSGDTWNIHLTHYGVLSVRESSTLLKENPPDQHFITTTVKDITENDRIVVLEDTLQDEIRIILKAQVDLATKNMEISLKLYFREAREAILEHYKQTNRSQRQRAILNKMMGLNPVMAKAIKDYNVLRWIKHIEEFDDDKMKLTGPDIKTQSPRREDHFLLFAEALSLNSELAKNYWRKGINGLRVRRILEGRKLGTEIKQFLIGALELRNLGVEPTVIETLFDIARKNTHSVEMVVFEGNSKNEE